MAAEVQMAFFCVCGECGAPIYGPQAVYTEAKRGKRGFHCINGHARQFVGETEEQKLKRHLEQMTNQRDRADAEAKKARRTEAAAKRKLKKAQA